MLIGNVFFEIKTPQRVWVKTRSSRGTKPEALYSIERSFAPVDCLFAPEGINLEHYAGVIYVFSMSIESSLLISPDFSCKKRTYSSRLTSTIDQLKNAFEYNSKK